MNKADEFSIVDIWVGSFSSETLFHQYFEEQYIDDVSPINKFAADQGVLFYDHDYCESKFNHHPVKSFDELIAGHSYWQSYVDEASKAFLSNDF